MLKLKRFFFTSLAALGIVGLLAACGGGGDDGPVFDPDVPPQDVEVVSGDGFNSELGNTISWEYDETATGHVVYWDTQPNVTVDSPQVVPTDTGRNYIIHADPAEVFAGETIYYLLVATAGDQVSEPSEVVSGTPQTAVTANSLNDLAWNGSPVDGSIIALVAVGDSGTILNSQNGTLDGWTEVDHGLTDESLAGVTWGNAQYLVVGAGNTVLTSPDGSAWAWIDLNEQNIPNSDLEDVAWTGAGYIVVGKNGAVLTGNADGAVWTEQSTGIDTAITLEGVAEGNGTLVAVGTKATIITSQDAGVTWTLIDLSAQSISNTNDLNDVTWDGTSFGVVGSNSTLLSSTDGLDWIENNPSISDYSLEGAVQWDPLLPANLPVDPLLAMVGSAGTFFVSDDPDSGYSVPTGTNEQLEAIIWVDIEDDGIEPYFIMVGHDGTLLTNQQ
ncbi:MAG: hypothetical protein ABFS39_00050 [Pseudomonadota bacterium]